MSRPEETLELLARTAREEEQLLAALERHAEGRSSPGDDARLRDLPPALLPSFSEERQQQLVEQIRSRLQAGAGEAASTGSVGRVSRRPRSLLWGTIAATAVAASIGVWFGAPRALAPLPSYELRVQGSQRSERAAAPETGPLRLRAGSRLRLELRPAADVTGEVRARLFARATGQRALGAELEVAQEQSSAGALRVEAEVPSSLPERGELALLVGRPAALAKVVPDGDEPDRLGLPASDARIFRRPFERVR